MTYKVALEKTEEGYDPVNGFTMAGIVRDAGLTEKQFRDLL